MKNNSNTQILGYTDAEWAGNFLDHKSTTGFCTFIGGTLVTWKSKKQTSIAHSSIKAEYRDMASIACGLIWLKGLLFDLGFLISQPMTLVWDNQIAMHIASNPIFLNGLNILRLTVTTFVFKFSRRLSNSLHLQPRLTSRSFYQSSSIHSISTIAFQA